MRNANLNRDVLSTTSSEESSASRNIPKFRKGSDSETERDRPVPTVIINNRRESRDGKDIQENGGSKGLFDDKTDFFFYSPFLLYFGGICVSPIKLYISII